MAIVPGNPTHFVRRRIAPNINMIVYLRQRIDGYQVFDQTTNTWSAIDDAESLGNIQPISELLGNNHE